MKLDDAAQSVSCDNNAPHGVFSLTDSLDGSTVDGLSARSTSSSLAEALSALPIFAGTPPRVSRGGSCETGCVVPHRIGSYGAHDFKRHVPPEPGAGIVGPLPSRGRREAAITRGSLHKLSLLRRPGRQHLCDHLSMADCSAGLHFSITSCPLHSTHRCRYSWTILRHMVPLDSLLTKQRLP